jgi:ferritin-like metal-binding protein YciE
MQTSEKTRNLNAELRNSEFYQLFMNELKEIYWAENHQIKMLPKMQKSAVNKELSKMLETHIKESHTHIETLENIFEFYGIKAIGKKCPAMEGLIEEARVNMEDTEKETMVRDAAMIFSAQKMEHYEIACYGTLRVFAETLGHQNVSEMLSNVLADEKAADAALTKIAKSFVNESAFKE